MKPFEDLLPEEEGNELIGLLREKDHTHFDITPAEQKQIAQRVRERLIQVLPAPLPEKEYEPGQVLMAPVSRPPVTRRQRLMRLASGLVAAVVVGVVIASAFLLFAPQRTIVSDLPIRAIKSSSTTSHVEAGGFDMTLGITSGPYFVGEMLEVNITLANHTSQAQWVASPFTNSACGYAAGVAMLEGLKPTIELPETDHSCPSGAGKSLLILPGKTLHAQKYFVLQWSGNITLTSYIDFRELNKNQGYQWYQPAKSPLDGHWPTLHLQVASQVPQDRQLTAHLKGNQITVDAPANAPLQYLFGVSCTNGPGSGSEYTGNYGWQPLQSTTINSPACSMKHITWSYAIGTPGYSIAAGNARLDT